MLPGRVKSPTGVKVGYFIIYDTHPNRFTVLLYIDVILSVTSATNLNVTITHNFTSHPDIIGIILTGPLPTTDH